MDQAGIATPRNTADAELPKAGQGYRAEVRFDDHHVIFLAVQTAVGPAVGVYDVKLNKWWKDRPAAADLCEAKETAENLARGYYNQYAGTAPVPVLQWTET